MKSDLNAAVSEIQEKFGVMKFDVVIGNPPYQETQEGDNATYAPPIYHKFWQAAEDVTDRVCLITPARFLFNAGSTPKDWNQQMLHDKHLKVEWYEQNSGSVFPNTDIKGGVVVCYRDGNKNFGEIGTFSSFPELNSILHKVAPTINASQTRNKPKWTLDTIMTGRGIYRLTDTALTEHPEVKEIQSADHSTDVGTGAFTLLRDIIFFSAKPNDAHEYVKVLGLVNNKREYQWIDKRYLSEPANFEKFKVVLPNSNGSGAIGEVLSTPLVGEPLVGFTETFIAIGAFDTRNEAEACLKYVKSKFARTMLGVLKITQHNPKSTWAKVPLQDFTANSDIDWSQPVNANSAGDGSGPLFVTGLLAPNDNSIDAQLYRKYGLDPHEIAFIESHVKPME
jgi:hypothetical protein